MRFENKKAAAKFFLGCRDEGYVFCEKGRKFTRRRTLPVAWKECKVGTWMAWWLFDFCSVPYEDVQRTQQFARNLGFRLMYCTPTKPAVEKKFAAVIRKHFNYDGTRKDGR